MYKGEAVYVFVRASERKRANALTHLCPLGTWLKISSSSSLLVSEQRLSALRRHPCGPPLLFHPSISQLHTHTHRITPHICTLLRTHNRVHKHTHQLHPAASLLYFLCRRPPVWLSAAQENRARDTEKGWWIKKTQECEEKQQIEWEKRAEEKCENVLKLSPIKTDLEGHKSLSHRTLSLSLSPPFAGDFRVVAASKRAFSVDVVSEVVEESCSGRGRVAQLMKTFSVSSEFPPSQTPPRGNKPPIPEKPTHLRLRPSPSLR